MPDRPVKPFYLDLLTRKHESYVYDVADSEVLEIEHEGRSLHLLMPFEQFPVAFRTISIQGSFLFAIAEQLDFQEDDGEVIDGGDGVLLIGVKLTDRDETYWTLAWHNLFELTLEALDRYFLAENAGR